MSKLRVKEIAHTNGTKVIGVNSDGSMPMPKQPRFYGRKSPNQTVSRATNTKITGFTAAEIDNHSAFDGTTFTCPVAGDYYLFASTYVNFSNAGNDGENMEIYLYVNGSNLARGVFRNETTRDIDNITLQVSFMKTLAVNDTVEVYVNVADNNGGDAIIEGDVGTYFGGYMLG